MIIMYKYKELYRIFKKQNQSVSMGDNKQYLKVNRKRNEILVNMYVSMYVPTNKHN